MSKFNLYLNDILRAIALIENSTKGKSFEDFKKDNELIDATAMRLQIIGESISKLPLQLRKRYGKVEWNKYLQTRNIISHAYFAVNKEILWSLIKDIPKLKEQVREILEKEE